MDNKEELTSRQSKLNDKEREQIFNLREQGQSIIQLSKQFNVSQTTIRSLLKKKTYQPNKHHWK